MAFVIQPTVAVSQQILPYGIANDGKDVVVACVSLYDWFKLLLCPSKWLLCASKSKLQQLLLWLFRIPPIIIEKVPAGTVASQ